MKTSTLSVALFLLSAAACTPVVATGIDRADGGSAGGGGSGGQGGGTSDGVLAKGVDACAIAVDATDVYFATCAPNGIVGKIPKGGGPVTTLASGLAKPVSVGVDKNHLYWVEQGGGTAQNPGYLKRIPLAGGGVETLVTDAFSPSKVQVGQIFVFFSDGQGLHGREKGSAYVWTPVPEPAMSTFEEQEDSGSFLWAAGSKLMMLQQEAPMPIELLDDPSGFRGIASDFEFLPTPGGVFVMTATALLKLGMTGSATNLVVDPKLVGGSLAAANGMVYWSALDQGVLRMTGDGTGQTTLAKGDYHAKAIALDDTRIYFATGATDAGALALDGAILSAPR